MIYEIYHKVEFKSSNSYIYGRIFLKVSKKIGSGLYANDMIKLDELNKFLLKI